MPRKSGYCCNFAEIVQEKMTEEQILIKLSGICARGEHCREEMRQKMVRWGIDEATQKRVLTTLVDEKFIDEERYARFFINDKVKFNHWGRRKVEQALWAKRIPREVYEPLLDEVSAASYEEVLLPLLRTKQRSVKGSSDYEIRMKLIRFALQRGFSYEQAEHCLDLIHNS